MHKDVALDSMNPISHPNQYFDDSKKLFEGENRPSEYNMMLLRYQVNIFLTPSWKYMYMLQVLIKSASVRHF